MADFKLFFLINAHISPKIEPATKAIKNTSSIFCHPKYSPNTAANFTSPPPMPPLDNSAIMNSNPPPSKKPIIPEIKLSID